MKILLLTIAIAFAFFQVRAQDNRDWRRTEPGYYKEDAGSEVNISDIKRAGEYLRKHSKQYYLGLAIMGGGYVAVLASLNSDSPELATLGSIAILGGIVVQIISHRQIGKAGYMLERSTLSRLKVKGASEGIGIGLAYNF